MTPEHIVQKWGAALELIKMLDRLLDCYRLGTRPSGATLDHIRRLRKEVAEETELQPLADLIIAAQRLKAWDAEFPRGRTCIVAYGDRQRSEDSLDEICDATKLALDKLAGE